MSRVRELKSHLKPGQVYRRGDLLEWSSSIDRHLNELVEEGTLKKLSQGVYFYPKKSVFGSVPPEEEKLISKFLNDDRFLVTSPNAYNRLGVGTTQLYNKRVVYNHKRHGEFKLGGRTFHFQIKPHFPNKLSEEFLIVDLVNNLFQLGEDTNSVLKNVMKKAATMDSGKLKKALKNYGNVKTKKVLKSVLE
ncbi:MAG: hypothetical protein IE931_10190 [Sphingobacteriales bacterium]|nr:hypothetical protein [Sphingobacteriales bacterium]